MHESTFIQNGQKVAEMGIIVTSTHLLSFCDT